MKKLLFILIAGICQLTVFNCFAQAPNAIPYQAVARNAAGNIIASQPVSLRVSIHDVTASGTVVFSETHSITTTSLGLFNINIGMGTPVAGTLAAVNWGNGAKFIQVEMDAAGGTAYVDMGTTQLMSSPYALYAETANVPGVPGPQGPQGATGAQGLQGIQGPQGLLTSGAAAGNTTYWNGSSWVVNNSNIYNNGANVGIGTTTPANKMDVEGGLAVGATYSGTSAAPTNGAIIEGNVGVGTSTVVNKLDVEGGIAIGTNYSGNSVSPTNGAIIEGNVGVGTNTVVNKLDVEGGVAIGATYSGTSAAPANGVIVQGNVGIGTTAVVNKLDVEGGVAIGATYSGTSTAPVNGAIFEGKVGLGTTAVVNKLDVEGGIAIGATYSGTSTAPVNGAIFEGNVGIGTSSPTGKLSVAGTVSIVDGTQAEGNVLTSDANGLAAWKKPGDLRSLISSINSVSCISNTASFPTDFNRDMFISGNYLYLISYETLLIYNISNPASITLSSTTNTGDLCSQIAVSGNYAYITQSIPDKLLIYNISNPASPTLANTGGTTIPADPDAIAVSGNYAIVCAYNSGLMYVYDVSTPASPLLLNGGSTNVGGAARAIRIAGNYTYVLTDRLLVYNISTPAAPVLMNPSATAVSESLYNMTVSGNYIYTIDVDGNKLRIYDISNPVSPVLKNPGGTTVGNNILDIAVNGIYAYVVNYSGDNFSVIDISDPTIPVLKSTANTATGDEPRCIAVSGNYVYVGTFGGQELKVFNAACATNPATTIAFDPATGNISSQVFTNAWNSSGTNIYNSNTGNVSIGTTTAATNTRLTVVKSTGSGLTILSGDTHYTSMGIGRTSSEVTLGVSEAANNFMTGSSAGDAIIRVDDNTKKIVMGAGIGTTATMFVTSSNVGIGQSSPQAPLHITGTGITTASMARTYFNLNTALTSNTSTSANVLVRADGWFWANNGGFIATSDKRIKNILGRTDNKKDLETLSQIKITDYKYIDEVSNGSGLQKKLIAQELKEIYPTAVNQNEGVIPNVYETAKAVEITGNYSIISTNKAHGFKTGDMVKLILSKAGEKMFVVAVIDEHRFRVEEKISDQVFVYGKNVKDLLNVDYDAVSMLNVSATQELYKMIIELQSENEKLKNDNNAFRTDIDKIKAQLGMITGAQP